MTVNLNEAALAVQEAIRSSEQYKNLKALYNAVQADPSAREMFENFRRTQMELQQMQMNGEDIPDQQVEQAVKIVALVQQHETIGKLMEAEQQMMNFINEFSQMMMKPLEELYGLGQ